MAEEVLRIGRADRMEPPEAQTEGVGQSAVVGETVFSAQPFPRERMAIGPRPVRQARGDLEIADLDYCRRRVRSRRGESGLRCHAGAWERESLCLSSIFSF